MVWKNVRGGHVTPVGYVGVLFRSYGIKIHICIEAEREMVTQEPREKGVSSIFQIRAYTTDSTTSRCSVPLEFPLGTKVVRSYGVRYIVRKEFDVAFDSVTLFSIF